MFRCTMPSIIICRRINTDADYANSSEVVTPLMLKQTRDNSLLFNGKLPDIDVSYHLIE